MTAVLPPLRLPTLDELRDARGPLPTMTAPEWDRPLVAAVLAAGLDLAVDCAGCGLPLVDHFGPLVQGEGPWHGFWYGSEDCCGGPGAPGSVEALLDAYGTTDPVVLRDRCALPEEISAAEWLASSGQAAA